jgi:hypothetical protein
MWSLLRPRGSQITRLREGGGDPDEGVFVKVDCDHQEAGFPFSVLLWTLGRLDSTHDTFYSRKSERDGKRLPGGDQ